MRRSTSIPSLKTCALMSALLCGYRRITCLQVGDCCYKLATYRTKHSRVIDEDRTKSTTISVRGLKEESFYIY